jgi:hypothetical protein
MDLKATFGRFRKKEEEPNPALHETIRKQFYELRELREKLSLTQNELVRERRKYNRARKVVIAQRRNLRSLQKLWSTFLAGTAVGRRPVTNFSVVSAAVRPQDVQPADLGMLRGE